MKQNISMTKYDDEVFEFQILNYENNHLVPLESRVDEVIFSLKSTLDGEKLIEKKLSDGTITWDNSTKKYSFWIYTEDTENLPLQSYICDLKRVIDGKEFTLAKFNLELTYSVCGKVDEDE